MIPVRMYQDERQLAWGNINISQNQAFIAESDFDPPNSGYAHITFPLRHSAE